MAEACYNKNVIDARSVLYANIYGRTLKNELQECMGWGKVNIYEDRYSRSIDSAIYARIVHVKMDMRRKGFGNGLFRETGGAAMCIDA